MNNSLKIFISYTVRDGLISKEVLEKLQATMLGDCNVYIDLLDNDSVDKQARVENELRMSDLVVIIKTININKSEWVKREINLANKYNIPIVEFNYKELIDNKFQPITMYIKHLADSANFKGGTLYKLCNGLIGNCFEMPNVSYI